MAFDQILRKHISIVVLPAVALAAAAHAQAIGQLIGVGLLPDAKALAAAPASSREVSSDPEPTRTVQAKAIFDRNPFDHVTGPLRATEPEESSPTTPDVLDTSDPWHAPTCEGVKVLVIAASRDPNWSMVALSTGSDPKSVLRRRGGEFGGKTVHYVGWDRVWFQSGSTLCQASVYKPDASTTAKASPDAASAPVTTPPPSPPKGGAPTLDPALAKGIQKISATDYNIDRGVVDKILENQADLMRQARIVPEQENGKVVGLRMFGLRPDTLLGTLGLENGDRLQTINGFDMGSPEKALEAYARLRTADKLTVQVTRRGQTMNLDYNIK